jgi:transposase
MSARASHRRPSNEHSKASDHSHGHPPHQEELRRQVEQQQREIEKLREQVAERDRQIADAERQIADAEKQIADLERQLAARKKNSTNSSKPPSSDGLAGTQRRRCSPRKKSGRKPGGQPGHMGQERPRVEKPDRSEEVLPLQCMHCGSALPQAPEERQTAGNVFSCQIVDLPEVILPVVTEYQYPKLVCPCCQKETRAELRSEHAHQIGERLTAVVSYLISVRKMTRRDVQATLQDLFGVDISVGSVQKAWEETADAVAAPYAELQEALATEPVINSDETGSRTNGEKRWVWALCSSWFVFYYIAGSRGVEVLVELLGEAFAGILCSDRCPTYLSYHRGLGPVLLGSPATHPQGNRGVRLDGGCGAFRPRHACRRRADVWFVVPVPGRGGIQQALVDAHRIDSAIGPDSEEDLPSGGEIFGQRGPRRAQFGTRILRELGEAIYVPRARGSRANQQCQ